MADIGSSSSSSSSEVPPSSRATADNSHLVHDRLERRSSKSRLLKQEVVEVAEEVELPTVQEKVDFHCTDSSTLPIIEQANVLSESKLESKSEAEEDEDHSPNSDSSDQTVVPAESLASSTATPHSSPKDNSPEDGSSIGGQKIPDSDKGSPTQAINPKVKLVRSQAVYDDASSPPPEILIRSAAAAVSTSSPLRDLIGGGGKDCVSPVPYSAGTATLSVSPTFQVRGLGRQRLGQDSSQGSTVSDNSPALSRDSSFETSYTDSTGTNLEEFIKKTLNKKQSDRTMLLHLESDMTAFIKDTSQEKHKFPQMSSYHRMLVHRVAAFFGLDHNVDETGKAVIIGRLECTRIPDFKFRDHIRDDLPQEDPPKKFILKRHRDCTSLEETRGTDRVAVDDRMSKSFEERQEEYHEARSRIFQQRELLQEMGGHQPVNRPSNLLGSNQSSKDDVRWHPDLRPWNSTDSSGYSTDSSSRLKVYVTKASSFHSVTVLTRGDSRTSTGSNASRFSKTDSLSSGMSNLGSPIVIPPTIPSSPPLEDQEFESGSSDTSAISPLQKALSAEEQTASSPFLSFTDETGEPLAIWVASTIDQIPPGSIIINPQSGEPYINADGSIYRWYPPSEWTTEKVVRSEELVDDNSSLAAEPSAVALPQDDNCAACHHQFSALSMAAEDTASDLEVASPSSVASHQPLQQVYLVAPGSMAPSVPASDRRVTMQQVYPAPLPPGVHKVPPFFSPPVPGVPSSVRYVCQMPVAGYPVIGNEGLDPQGQSQTQFECLPPSYPSDICQVMTFPQQMTIHSVETYQHSPPDHGYVPQMMPCMYVPQYSPERVENPQKTNQIPNPQQILYVPTSSAPPACYTIEGACAQSVPNQGQVQVIRVNTAPSHGASSHVFYTGAVQSRSASGQGAPPLPPSGPSPQYVCYTYPTESSHLSSASMPLVHSYPSMPMAPASFVRPTRMNYPATLGQARSSSPKSPQQRHPPSASTSQFKMYVGNPVMRASSMAESGTDPGRELIGTFLPRQHLPSARLMPVRQPQVVFSTGPPASFPLGDARLPMQNVPTVFQNIVRPRARVPDAILCEHADQLSQSSSSSASIRDGSSREDTTKGQPRLG